MYLEAINLTTPWHMCPNWPRSLRVCVSFFNEHCCMSWKEGICFNAKCIFGELCEDVWVLEGFMQIDFVSLMRSLSILRMLGMEKMAA